MVNWYLPAATPELLDSIIIAIKNNKYSNTVYITSA